jgi:hypothetical protein
MILDVTFIIFSMHAYCNIYVMIEIYFNSTRDILILIFIQSW